MFAITRVPLSIAVAAAAICDALPVRVVMPDAVTVAPGTLVSNVVSVVAATDPVSETVTVKSLSKSIASPTWF